MPTPARFAYVLQFDRRPDFAGTAEQQQTIRDSVTANVTHGSPLNRVMHGVARLVKYHMTHVQIEFHPGMGAGRANEWTIYLGDNLAGEELIYTFWHELAHVIGMHFFNDQSEGWAHPCGVWAAGGGRKEASPGTEHYVWTALRERLDQFDFAGSPPVT